MIRAFAEVDALVREGLGTSYSAAVVRIASGGRPRFARAYGTVTSAPGAAPVAIDARFDLASITKVFVATVALAQVADGSLALDATLTGLVPEWRDDPHAPIVLRSILAHDAGFRSGADYRTLLGADVERFALCTPLICTPRERVVYSDLGYIALGTILARRAGRGLAALVLEELARFGARATRYGAIPGEIAAIPATEREAWRGLVWGTVHDEKAALLGGVAGHAGLFGTAADVERLGEWYLAALHGRPTPLDPGLAREAVREQAFDPVLRRGLGWALKTTDENSCGTRMSRTAFGHTGFTGTSFWADPERDASVTILTNAVHFGRADLRPVRAAICDAALEELDR
ncbi:MAG: serine hydrolase domain-containing protein [Candidatus Velthaea sp.]|jgi:CubicO group peptidase (beta-lactamase class C family)